MVKCQSAVVRSGYANGCGKVAVNDLTILLSYIGGSSGAELQVVREPAMIVLLLAGGVGLLGCACRRRLRYFEVLFRHFFNKELRA
jgi:hypothetical protein